MICLLNFNVITLGYNTITMRTVKGKIRKIGNSAGILFSKQILEQSGITGDVNIMVKKNMITISRSAKPKKTWADFKKVKHEKAPLILNKFDTTEWTW